MATPNSNVLNPSETTVAVRRQWNDWKSRRAPSRSEPSLSHEPVQ
jgi:hypothetical protein